eukprot:1105692-Pleurochrysis_carterae.AAC.1
MADAPQNCAYALAPGVATAESQDSRQVNCTLRRVSLHGGELDLDHGRNEGVDGVPMEVRTAAATTSAS